MMNRRKFLLTGAGLPLLSSCASGLEPVSGGLLPAFAKRLDASAVSYAVLRSGVPQASQAVVGAPDAIFQAASLTKPVVAFAALRMAQAGQLELAAPVSHYLSDGYRHFHDPLRRSDRDSSDLVPAKMLERVTVGQLLNHSSGFPNWSSKPLAFVAEPGQGWNYSGEGYVLLQGIMEAITRTGLAAYLDQHLFAPLEMRDTSLVWREAFEERAVPGKMFLGLSRRARFRNALAASTLYTTAADYARFMAAFLADDALMQMTLAAAVDVSKPLGLAWGLGWGIERGAGGSHVWQWGNNPGFRAFAMASTTTKDGFVVLTNSERGMPLAASIAQLVLPSDHGAFRFPPVA
ncbi:serine hydrolase domain-containing protein [Pseudoduganella sp. S-14]|uniref:serine hydrolase domain-containing protein n=1 Tax=Pseudoduganella sp. S-14 TaxID=3404065 RepID=UPI003CE81A70